MARQYKTNEVKVDLSNYRHYWRGVKKIGKTTLFKDFILKLYGDLSYGLLLEIGNEEGQKAIDGVVYDIVPDWMTLSEIVDDLIENKEDNNFKFIAFDTVDELIKIGQREVIRLDYKKSGERHEFNACFGGYGAPREKLVTLIDDIMTRLARANYGLVWIGHTKYKTINEKSGDSYEQLTSNLNTDFDGIFANKADIVMMINAEREIEEGKIVDTKRYMWFRGDGFVDAGGRFPDIEQKVEFSVDNYVNAVTDAIKKSITSKKVDDKYIAEKAKQEQAEKEAYYQEHKEELSSAEAFSEATNTNEAESVIESIINSINDVMRNLSQADRDKKKVSLTSAGLPATPALIKKCADVVTLNKILEIVKA
jgi:hypothetical protein